MGDTRDRSYQVQSTVHAKAWYAPTFGKQADECVFCSSSNFYTVQDPAQVLVAVVLPEKMPLLSLLTKENM